MYFLGEPVAVTGFLGNLCHKDVPGYTAEDVSVGSIRFKSGALANIAATNCAVPGEWRFNIAVVCQNVMAYFQNLEKVEFVSTDRKPPQREVMQGETEAHFEETAAFIGALRGEAPNVFTLEDGLNSLKLVEAVVKSSETGQTVYLDS